MCGIQTSIIARAEFENEPIDALYCSTLYADLNRAIADYKSTGNTEIIRDAIDSRVARSLRSVDGLLAQEVRDVYLTAESKHRSKRLMGLRILSAAGTIVRKPDGFTLLKMDLSNSSLNRRAWSDVSTDTLSDPRQARSAANDLMWSIGIYTGDSPFQLRAPANKPNPVLSQTDVTDVSAEFVADPFHAAPRRPLVHVLRSAGPRNATRRNQSRHQRRRIQLDLPTDRAPRTVFIFLIHTCSSGKATTT